MFLVMNLRIGILVFICHQLNFGIQGICFIYEADYFFTHGSNHSIDDLVENKSCIIKTAYCMKSNGTVSTLVLSINTVIN